MTNKIILINPKTGIDIGASLSPPSALLCLAAELDTYNVKIIDQRTDPNWKIELIKEIKKDPLCIGITSMCGKQILYGLEISRFVKEQDENIPIMWGGIHPSFFPQETLENKYIDFVIRGEGERTFYELVDSLKNKKNFGSINGLSYKHETKIIHNKDRAFLDMNSLKPTPWYLIDVNKYIHSNMFIKGSNRELDIGMTTRGCPYRCKFCLNASYNRGLWRSMSAKKTAEKIINDITQFNLDAIWLRDDNFFVDMKRVEEIIKILTKEKIDIRWYTSGMRIDTFNKLNSYQIDLLKKSGCESFRFGVESGSQRMLDLIGKHITIHDVLNANIKAKKYRITPYYSFMCGLPTETAEEAILSVKLANKLKKDNKHAKIAEFTMYVPYPGTELFDVCITHGLKLPKKLEEWAIIDHVNSISKNMIPSYIKKQDFEICKNILDTSMIASDMVWDILPIKYKAGLYFMRKWAQFRWNNLLFKNIPEIKIWSYLSDKFLNLKNNI